jgi:hypothetical protein
MTKSMKKLGTDCSLLNTTEAVYERKITNIIPNRKKLKTVP